MDYAEVYRTWGHYIKKKEYDMAINKYKTAIKYKPNYEEAYMNIGTIFQEMKIIIILYLFNKSIDIQSDYSEAHNNIGKLYFIVGLRKKALTHYKSLFD